MALCPSGRDHHRLVDHRCPVDDMRLHAVDKPVLQGRLASSGACATKSAIGVRLMYCHRNSAGAGSRNVHVETVADTSVNPASRSSAATASGSFSEKTGVDEATQVGADVLDEGLLHQFVDRLGSGLAC